MNLKNYTTTVPADRSITQIEKLLVNFGARNIMKEYGPSQEVAAISFLLDTHGQRLAFKLPGNVSAVFLWLSKQKKGKRTKIQDEALLAQAERICWKQQYEWLHLQLSQIELGQAEALELFFPRLYNASTRTTYYDQMKENKFKNLLPNAQ